MAFVPSALPEPPRRGRRPRAAAAGTRTPLSRERIVDAALAIVDAGGLDALSMRSVAQALDTGPASLYAHVADKAELLALLIERRREEMRLPEPDPEHWQEQLKDMVREMRAGLMAHRDLARAALAEVPLGEGGLCFTERCSRCCASAACPTRSSPTAATCSRFTRSPPPPRRRLAR